MYVLVCIPPTDLTEFGKIEIFKKKSTTFNQHPVVVVVVAVKKQLLYSYFSNKCSDWRTQVKF